LACTSAGVESTSYLVEDERLGAAPCQAALFVTVRAALGIDAFISESQPLDGPSANQVLGNNFFRILGSNVAVPNRFRVNDHRWAMFALVEATRFVDAHPARHSCQPCRFRKLLQLWKQFAFAVRCAGTPRRSLGTNILADKHVTLKKCQN